MADSESRPAGRVRWRRICGVLLLAVLGAEGLGQLYFRIWSGQWLRSTQLYVWSPYGLVRNNPNATSPQFRINANGFRDMRDYERRKRPGTIRVVLLGGSVLYSGIAETFLESEGRVDSRSTIAQFLQQRLAADPAFAGVTVEVLNAAVNFNRIVEVATAYAGEYAWWDPDLVVVFGSANNFFDALSLEQFQAGAYGVRLPHPWERDCQRLANERSLATWLELGARAAADHSALATMLSKIASKVLDAAQGLVNRYAVDADTARTPERAPTADEETPVFEEYAALVEGVVAMARARGQDLAFFWEYHLNDLRHIKPLSEAERGLARTVPEDEGSRAFHFRMRDRWTAYLRDRGVPSVDPLERFRREPGTIFIDYLHYTRHGNAVMADEVYRAVRPGLVARIETHRAAAGK